ncbi:hypothetical protein [Burkholderia sp. Bp9004]|uniref:hypothetical protein n=1 Tax=Burkholderia sp. Bp9004 TaxID=2184559 RepID=UPI000F5E2A98|nr:hypothetical protein [Burkholderia sp. Bp9004]
MTVLIGISVMGETGRCGARHHQIGLTKHMLLVWPPLVKPITGNLGKSLKGMVTKRASGGSNTLTLPLFHWAQSGIGKNRLD